MIDIGAYDRDDEMVEAVRGDGRPRLRVERCPGVAVVLGRGGKPEVELCLDAVRRDAVPVLRRRGGGCAVVLDPGNAVVSLVLPLPGVGRIDAAFAGISSWLADGLDRVGVGGVRQRGTSDLALGDRKIGGSCIYRARDLLYYSTTLLVEPDLDRVESYLAHPPREPAYRAGRTHREFLGRLADVIGTEGIEAFVTRLRAALVRMGVPPGLSGPARGPGVPDLLCLAPA